MFFINMKLKERRRSLLELLNRNNYYQQICKIYAHLNLIIIIHLNSAKVNFNLLTQCHKTQQPYKKTAHFRELSIKQIAENYLFKYLKIFFQLFNFFFETFKSHIHSCRIGHIGTRSLKLFYREMITAVF